MLSRVDANVYNTSLIVAWNNDGTRLSELNRAMKDIFLLTIELDMVLNLTFVASSENQSDEASRTIPKIDATLSLQIQNYFGGKTGHTCDMMALTLNNKRNRSNQMLPHFTGYLTPNLAGVNTFEQEIVASENYYGFQSFNMTLPESLKLITGSNARLSIVMKCESFAPAGLPAVQENIYDAF